MNKQNKDGFISGGYIFDVLDRLAQTLALAISDKPYCFTAWAIPMFHKQLCDTSFITGINWRFKIGKRIFVKVYMRNKNKVKVASCIFCFVEKDKNFCEVK